MPHLPFASLSSAGSAFGATGFDGTFRRLPPFDPTRPSTTTSSGFAPIFRKAASGTNVGGDTARSAFSAAAFTSAAFTGAIDGHFGYGGTRVGDGKPSRPPLADVQHVRTRHPCDEPPGPGKYEPAMPMDAFASYQRENEREGKLSRRATAGLGQTSAQSRMASPVPREATPGPGAYPLSEFSDFAARSRMLGVRGLSNAPQASMRGHVRSPPSTSNTAVLDGYRDSHSTRAATSSFGTAPRSSITGGGPTNGGEFNRFGIGYTNPPSGGTYSPLGNQDVVWLSMKRDTAPPPRFAKKPPKVHVYEVASRRSW